MNPAELRVEVQANGRVTVGHERLRLARTGQVPPFTGGDAELIRLFERWIERREQRWEERDVRAFGAVLHRYLFPREIWSYVEGQLDDARTPKPLRIALTFPADPPFSRLAAIPWEYLYRPDRPERDGFYLALDPRCVLTRYIPLRDGRPALRPVERVRFLLVVSRPRDARLNDVISEPVEDVLRAYAGNLNFDVERVENPSADGLFAAIEAKRPHVVHFMGHGRYSERLGEGGLALVDADRGTEWVSDRDLASGLRRVPEVPRVIVLHACEGSRADFTESFAGLAPQMVRAGVQCVVAMHFPVTNDTASAFSSHLYERLAAGDTVDQAAQAARLHIGGRPGVDPRLLGVPAVYLHSRSPLLAARGQAVQGEAVQGEAVQAEAVQAEAVQGEAVQGEGAGAPAAGAGPPRSREGHDVAVQL